MNVRRSFKEHATQIVERRSCASLSFSRSTHINMCTLCTFEIKFNLISDIVLVSHFGKLDDFESKFPITRALRSSVLHAEASVTSERK